MLPYIQEELKVYYTHFQNECKKAFEGLESLKKIADKVATDIDEQIELNQSKITDKHLSSLKLLVLCGETLEKFNNEMELCFSRIQPELYHNTVKTMQLPLYEPKTIFKSDLSTYNIGTGGECVITYIKDLERDLCFIVDVGRTLFCSVDFALDVKTKVEGTPKIGIIYGIYFNEKVFRCIRVPDESSSESCRINLIDIGELINIPKDSQVVYHLTDTARVLPPAAILCLVEKLDGKPMNCLKRTLTQKHFTFKVTEVCTNMLHIELFSAISDIESPFVNFINNRPQFLFSSCAQSYGLQSQPQPPQFFSPFGPTKNMKLEYQETPSQILFDSNSKRMFNTPQASLTPQDSPNEPKTGDTSNEQKSFSHLIKNLSQIELSSLQAPFFDQFNSNRYTTAQTKSSTPVIPKQAESVKHEFMTENSPSPINETTCVSSSLAGNFEQSSSNLLNNNLFNITDTPKSTKTDSSISTPNRLSSNSNNSSRCPTGAYSKNSTLCLNQCAQRGIINNPAEGIDSINLPAVGETITIFPTHIISVEQFYGQISIKSSTDKLEEIQNTLNSSKETLKPIIALPAIGQLVLAMYSADNNIYRAQIKHIQNQNNIQVVYVDYGNTAIIPAKQIFQWEPICNTLPLQAIFCTIPNVKMRKENDQEAIEYLEQRIMNKQFDAIVRSNDDGKLVVHLTDNEGFDIGEELCARELALLPV